MIIIGIDPGSLKTGFGVLRLIEGRIEHVNHGTIFLEEEPEFSGRLLGLAESLSELFEKYQPEAAVVEKIFLGKNPDSAFKLGHARGVVICEAARHKMVISEYATRVVKKSVAGTGSADKDQVMTALLHQLRIRQIVNHDASDALALAYHHCQQLIAFSRMREMER